jgi:hypothetical protein
MTTKSQSLHFTIGEDAGKLLMQIAQEHLLYNYNPDKAIKTLTESLHGCPMDLALQILKGDVVLIVNEEEQYILPKKRDEKIHADFPKLDLKNWYKRTTGEITKTGEGLEKALDDMLFTMSTKKLRISYDWSQILDFIAGNDKAILDELWETEEVSQLDLLVRVTKNYIEKSVKIKAIIDWLSKIYPGEFETLNFDSEYFEILLNVSDLFNDLLKQNYSKITKQIDSVQNFIDASLEINKVLSDGIKPVNIMDNWSAGWLSPEGKYYALNGEIYNYLHIQIANALMDANIIPQKEIEESIHGSDAWLEQHGWVKIHDNNINFAGCLNDKVRSINVDLTNVQIKIIYEYIALCHNGIMRLGWKQEKISASRFQMMAENLPLLYKTYFEF